VQHHLLDEERVALGLGVHGPHERRGSAAGPRLDQGADAALIEPVERDALEQPVAAQVGEQLGKRVIGRGLGVAVGGQDQ
jgi:hypothetical protein